MCPDAEPFARKSPQAAKPGGPARARRRRHERVSAGARDWLGDARLDVPLGVQATGRTAGHDTDFSQLDGNQLERRDQQAGPGEARSETQSERGRQRLVGRPYTGRTAGQPPVLPEARDRIGWNTVFSASFSPPPSP